jgi:hypothetical protein
MKLGSFLHIKQKGRRNLSTIEEVDYTKEKCKNKGTQESK